MFRVVNAAMPRLSRLDSPGLLHHVIIRGIERRKIFNDDQDRNNFIDRLSDLLPESGTQCYAWAFMTNHAHFLFRSGPSGLSTLMRRLLTGYAVSYNRRHRRPKMPHFGEILLVTMIREPAADPLLRCVVRKI